MHKIIEALQNPPNSQRKGDLLELVLVDLLRDMGFQQVEKQQSGTQFGFDVIAYKTSHIDGQKEVWKFECKNLTGRVTLNDIAPKLIWHSAQSTLDHFVIVSPSTISNDLTFLLENHSFPMPISLWTGEILGELIEHSPNAMMRLGFSFNSTPKQVQNIIDNIPSFAPHFFTLDVVHELNPPYSFDYIKSGNEILKAYTEHEFRLLVSVTNLTKKPLIIKSLDVTTLEYRKIKGRVIRLHKAKGMYQPRELTFIPPQTPGDKKNILGKNIWEIASGSAEIIALIMPTDISPGLYQIMFSVDALINGEQTTRCSPQFIVHIRDKDTDLILLQVNNRHYESPIPTLLNLSDKDWNKIKEHKRKENTFTFLGPTLHEMMFGYEDSTWTIRSCDAEPREDGITLDLDPYKPSELIMDLGIEIDEELICGPEAIFKYMMKKNKQEDIVPTQLKRKAIFKSLE